MILKNYVGERECNVFAQIISLLVIHLFEVGNGSHPWRCCATRRVSINSKFAWNVRIKKGDSFVLVQRVMLLWNFGNRFPCASTGSANMWHPISWRPSCIVFVVQRYGRILLTVSPSKCFMNNWVMKWLCKYEILISTCARWFSLSASKCDVSSLFGAKCHSI